MERALFLESDNMAEWAWIKDNTPLNFSFYYPKELLWGKHFETDMAKGLPQSNRVLKKEITQGVLRMKEWLR